MKYQFASLFSGCGGFDLGFIARGFRPLGAYDCDPDACANYEANIKGPMFRADLTKEIPNEQQLHNIDVLIAGPPCQGFSTAGKRLFNDARNQLLTLTSTIAQRTLPKVLIVENVPGVLAGKHSKYWSSMIETLQVAGYRTHTLSYQVLDLGMAQMRKRVLLFAWRTPKESIPNHPKLPPGNIRKILSNVRHQANHQPEFLRPQSPEWKIAQRIKPGQKLSNVRGGSNSVAYWDIPEVYGHVTQVERKFLEMLRQMRRQDRKRSYGDADPVAPTKIKKAYGTDYKIPLEKLIAKRYLRKVDGGIDLVGTFNGKFRRASFHGQSSTVDTRFGVPRYFLHPSQDRGFTVREAARLQGFNDSYIFHGTETAQFRVIGNAVPPPLSNMAADIALQLLNGTSS